MNPFTWTVFGFVEYLNGNFMSRLRLFWPNLVKFVATVRVFKIPSTSSFISPACMTFVFIVLHFDIRIWVDVRLPSIMHIVVDLFVYECRNRQLWTRKLCEIMRWSYSPKEFWNSRGCAKFWLIVHKWLKKLHETEFKTLDKTTNQWWKWNQNVEAHLFHVDFITNQWIVRQTRDDYDLTTLINQSPPQPAYNQPNCFLFLH
jgi:hypothetical protein